MPEMRQDVSLGAYVAHSSGRQAHGLPGVPLRSVRHGGEVTELPSFAHVATASGHQHERPTSNADAQ